MPYSKRFGELVKRHIAESGVVPREIAPEVRVHYTTLYDWGKGNAPAYAEPIDRLADVLRLSENDRLELHYEAGTKERPQRTEEFSAAFLREWEELRNRWVPLGIKLRSGPDQLALEAGETEEQAVKLVHEWDRNFIAASKGIRLRGARDTSRTAPDLAGLSFGEHDSPQNRFRSVLNNLYVKYTGLGWKDVPHPQAIRYYSGGQVATEREADLYIAAWLEDLGKRNPGRPAPEELAEYEERLAEG